jgi:hypothetical protein
VCAANAGQYNQAHTSPFASDPLLPYFGYRGDTQGANSLLRGILPPSHIMSELQPETQILLTVLANYHKTMPREEAISPKMFAMT